MEMFPICFGSLADYERWRASFQAKLCSHCRDCLPAYQLRMKKLRRCEHPDVMFSIEDEGVVGVVATAPAV